MAEAMQNLHRIAYCEYCDAPIYHGHPYAVNDGCYVCSACSPMLSCVIQQHKDALENDPEPWFDFGYADRQQMEAGLAEYERELVKSGDLSIAQL